MKRRTGVPGWTLLLLTGCLSAQVAAPSNPVRGHTPFATFGKLPLYFVENGGVYADEVAYSVRGADKTLFFTNNGITFRLKGKERAWVVKLEFVGANPGVVLRGRERQPAVFSYFKGPEKDWRTGLRSYSKITYHDLWPGIDLVYQGSVSRLKYQFVVKPGADPAEIRLRYHGVTSLTTTESGALRVETPEGSFEDAPPEAWQEIDGRRVPVGLAYEEGVQTTSAAAGFGFRVGSYDRTQPLVLDPVILVYCGYIGGGGRDHGGGIAVDSTGNTYVTGYTESSQQTFPVKVGPDPTYNGMALTGDAFVAKVNATGTALLYCGYIGGVSRDEGLAIAMDAAGNAYVAGSTYSDETTFPVSGGPDLTHNGDVDAFVAKVNARGTALLYCGYIGGSGHDVGHGIAVDAAGNAYVAGITNSDQQTFPVAVGPDVTLNDAGYGDAFVAKVNAQGSGLAYCGYIGGAGKDYANGIAVDAGGSAYVTGTTFSDQRTFPVAVGPDVSFNNALTYCDAFVAKVNARGTALAYCGYIGGAAYDEGRGIAVDAAGNAYVTGEANSDERTFPVKVGPDLTFNLNVDAFVAKVNAQGSGLAYCGYIGGITYEAGFGVAVDSVGNAYVTGTTLSDQQTFPVAVGPDVTFNDFGFRDAFVAKVNAPGTALVYCGYIGGRGHDIGQGIAVDAAGNAYIGGGTEANEQTFPVTVGPDLTFNGGSGGMGDAFVAKVALLDTLTASGTPRPGGTIAFKLFALEVRGLPYQLATSLGTGPISIDTRQLNLSADGLLDVSVGGMWPSVFSGYRGVIDSRGQARAAIHVPSIPALIGVRLHSAFVTLDPAAPSGIRSISNTLTFSIAK